MARTGTRHVPYATSGPSPSDQHLKCQLRPVQGNFEVSYSFPRLGLKNKWVSSSSLLFRMNHCSPLVNLWSFKGVTLLRGGRGISQSIFHNNRSSNARHGEDLEQGRNGSEGDGRCQCTPFGRTMCWSTRHALASRAACARSLMTMEWGE